MEKKCWLPKRVTQIAQKEGLIKKAEELICPFAQVCLGIADVGEENCYWLKHLEKNPIHRTIYLNQGHQPPPPSPRERFISRLEKTARIRGLR